jgi:hypothetical protein
MAEPRRVAPREFRERGYLHEVNRLVLHPLGLTLAVALEECPFCEHEEHKADCGMCDEHGLVERLGVVWDHRDSPEGIYLGTDALSPEKAQAVYGELLAHREARLAKLGYVVQPVPGAKTLDLGFADRSRDHAYCD